MHYIIIQGRLFILMLKRIPGKLLRGTRMPICCLSVIFFGLWLFRLPDIAYGFDWSTTEIHYQYGNLKRLFLREEGGTSVVTFQHANGWRFGDNFLFFDVIMPHDGKADYLW